MIGSTRVEAVSFPADALYALPSLASRCPARGGAVSGAAARDRSRGYADCGVPSNLIGQLLRDCRSPVRSAWHADTRPPASSLQRGASNRSTDFYCRESTCSLLCVVRETTAVWAQGDTRSSDDDLGQRLAILPVASLSRHCQDNPDQTYRPLCVVLCCSTADIQQQRFIFCRPSGWVVKFFHTSCHVYHP